MDPDTKQAVLAETEKQGEDDLLNSLKSQVEKEEQPKQQGDDGMTM